MSSETIYQSLFIQGKGTLRMELWRCLRTGRATRRPQGRPASTKGQLRDMVSRNVPPRSRTGRCRVIGKATC